MQPCAEDILDVEVHHEKVFAKALGARQQLTALIENDAAPVEDQLILPADKVEVGDNGAAIGCAGGEHALARGLLAHKVRRGADVEQQLCASGRLLSPWAGGIPD